MSNRAHYMYKVFDSQFNEANIKLNRMLSSNPLYQEKYTSVFDMARVNTGNLKDPELQKVCKKYWGGMQMRKNVVYNNPSKLIMTRTIMAQFPDRK